jgi:polysaccharide export outer membrane protein
MNLFKFFNMKTLFILFVISIMFGCSTKKNILYVQDIDQANPTELHFETPTIQASDILKITVSTLDPSAAIPYNKATANVSSATNLELMRLEGYEVTKSLTIEFPQLGTLSVKNLTTSKLASTIKQRLESEGHLINPVVNVRLINAKFTVLGEVTRPGTYNFTETKLTLLQAIGMAGDLTINGQRKNIKLIREINQERSINHIDLTVSDWMNSENYYIYPNDVIIIDPNTPRIKSAGFVGNVGTVVTVVSVLLSSIILLTR